MKRLLRSAALIAATFLCASPAVAGFTKIPFKYTSLTHLGHDGSQVHTRLEVTETVDLLANILRANGATVTSIVPNNTMITQTDGDRSCEAWSNTIFRAEFAAYNANNFKQYQKIDRTGAPAGCSVTKPSWLQYGYSAVPLDDGSGFKIVASLDRSRDVSTSTMRVGYRSILGPYASGGMWSLVPSTNLVHQNFETVFVVFVWRGAADRETSVFAIGVPKSDGIEASPNASIGYALRPVADGKIESVAVQSLLAFVAQKSLTAQ